MIAFSIARSRLRTFCFIFWTKIQLTAYIDFVHRFKDVICGKTNHIWKCIFHILSFYQKPEMWLKLSNAKFCHFPSCSNINLHHSTFFACDSQNWIFHFHVKFFYATLIFHPNPCNPLKQIYLTSIYFNFTLIMFICALFLHIFTQHDL